MPTTFARPHVDHLRSGRELRSQQQRRTSAPGGRRARAECPVGRRSRRRRASSGLPVTTTRAAPGRVRRTADGRTPRSARRSGTAGPIPARRRPGGVLHRLGLDVQLVVGEPLEHVAHDRLRVRAHGRALRRGTTDLPVTREPPVVGGPVPRQSPAGARAPVRRGCRAPPSTAVANTRCRNVSMNDHSSSTDACSCSGRQAPGVGDGLGPAPFEQVPGLAEPVGVGRGASAPGPGRGGRAPR